MANPARRQGLIDYLQVDEEVYQALIDQCPEVEEAGVLLVDALPSLTDTVHSLGDEALSAAFSQATNDLLDLLHDVVTGRGRPALRSARSLFELLVTTLDVATSTEAAERYKRHKAVLAHQEWKLDLPETTLTGNDRRGEAHRRRKLLKAAEGPYQRALDDFGGAFNRGWAQGSLADRAAAHGLSEFYAFYRLSSGVLHGSSGGILGQHRTIDGRSVHRVGPALRLCPVALLYGVTFYRRTLEAIGETTGHGRTRQTIAALDRWLGLWQELRRVLHRLDDDLWPNDPPARLVAVLACHPGDRLEWWCWDQDHDRIRRAEAPDLTEEQSVSIHKLTADAARRDLDHPISIVVAGIHGVPLDGAPWVAASESDFLVQEPAEGWWSLGDLNPLNPHVVDEDDLMP